MGGIREVQFVVGPETSTQPTGVTPSDDADLVTKGYADDTYTPKQDVYGSVATISALKAIGASDRVDEQIVFLTDLDTIYEFDSASSATPDDDLIVQPTSGTGRWIKWNITGGTSSMGSSIEGLLQKLDAERLGVLTNDIDNSIGVSGVVPPAHKSYTQRLMKNYTASDAAIELWHNPTVPWSADPALDSATGWTATNAGGSLAASNTAGDFQLGTHGLKFDKAGTNVAAGIRYDLGAQTFSAYQNKRVWFKVKMPSVTQLDSIKLRIYADTTSNFSTYSFALANGQYDGSAITTGWNTFLVDVSAAGTAGGTGWVYTQLARYFEIEVVTTASGQTYTGIVVDSFGFSEGEPQRLGVIGDSFTIYNNSSKDDLIIASSNTRFDGPLTLAASLANSYVGTTGTSRAALERSKLLISDGQISMDNDSGLSGTITLAQKVRLQTILRESLSTAYKVAVDVVTPQFYKVTAVGGSSLGLEDPENTSANLVNTNVLHLFSIKYSQGKTRAIYVGDMTVTSSSASGGTTTVNGTPPGGLTANYAYAVKKHLTSSRLSAVSTPTTNESFSSLSLDASPNGLILLDTAKRIPYQNNLLGLWNFEGANPGKKKFGSAPDLETVGTLQQTGFKSGHKGITGWSSSNYFRIQNGSNSQFNTQTKMVISLWFYPTKNDSYRVICGRPNASFNAGWTLGYRDGGLNIQVDIGSGSEVISSNVLVLNQWQHILMQFESGATNGTKIYRNAVLIGQGTTTNTDSGGVPFSFGYNEASGGSALDATDVIAQPFIWNGVNFTQAEVDYMYNLGQYTDWGFGGQLRHIYTANGQSGQKVSYEGELSRTTTAITPAIQNIAVIQS